MKEKEANSTHNVEDPIAAVKVIAVDVLVNRIFRVYPSRTHRNE
jgi:hypothetical protein